MAYFLQSVLIILQNSAEVLWELFPYILFGVIVGEILKLTSWTKLIYKGISKSPSLSIIVAVMLGIVSPLCTYGTVPVVLQLYRAGIHIAPLVAFLAASSLMNPQLFIYTSGGLDMEMALVRAGAVLIFGILLGFLLYKIPSKWVVNTNLQREHSAQEEILHRAPKVFKWKSFLKDTLSSLQYVGFYMIIGIVAGAVIEEAVPGKWLLYLFEPGRWMSLFLAALLSVPLSACGGAAITLVREFIHQGMSRGAALTFFIVGQATRPTPLIALSTILRPLFIVVYVIFLVVFSVIIGFLYH